MKTMKQTWSCSLAAFALLTSLGIDNQIALAATADQRTNEKNATPVEGTSKPPVEKPNGAIDAPARPTRCGEGGVLVEDDGVAADDAAKHLWGNVAHAVEHRDGFALRRRQGRECRCTGVYVLFAADLVTQTVARQRWQGSLDDVLNRHRQGPCENVVVQ